MHAPDSPRELAAWIRELDSKGKLYLFYKSPEWKSLRAEVMADHHGECADCIAHGKVSRAVTVHHEHEVRREPSRALDRWDVDNAGIRSECLVPLCHACHDARHGRFRGSVPSVPLTEERW